MMLNPEVISRRLLTEYFPGLFDSRMSIDKNCGGAGPTHFINGEVLAYAARR
jgi:hypothetical protein